MNHYRYDVVYLCSVALLKGHVLRAGPYKARLREDCDAFDVAQIFIDRVGVRIATACARRALNQRGAIRWI